MTLTSGSATKAISGLSGSGTSQGTGVVLGESLHLLAHVGQVQAPRHGL